MLLSPLQILDLRVPVPAPSDDLLSTRHTVAYDRVAESGPDSYKLCHWDPSFDKSETYRIEKALMRMRYSLLESPDLQIHSSLSQKYLQPVIDVSHRFFFSPDNTHGPLQATLTEGHEGHIVQVGFHVDDADAPNRTWKGSCSGDIPWERSKRCICIVIFAEPGAIQAERVPCSLQAGPMANLVKEAAAQCEETEATVAIITDEIRSLVVRRKLVRSTWINAEIFSTDEVSIRRLIAHFVYCETFQAGLCALDFIPPSPIRSGAEARRQPRPLPRLLLRRSFEDFDVYTMQRNRLAWGDFMIWWKIYSEEAKISGKAPWSLRPGTCLPVSQPRIFAEGGHNTWVPQGRPFFPIPAETKALVTQHHRPRDDYLHNLLYTGKIHDPDPQGHWFQISAIIRAGSDLYSQTFLGHFDSRGPLLCLKLFDERFFPLPEWRPWHCARQRLNDLNLAIDMARREEAAYKRLEYLQGSLLPHCYGFHKFLLPGGWHVYGLLMEAINGPTMDMSDIKDRPREQQIDIIRRLRHGLRAVRFAGIEQTDWKLDQILCPPNPENSTFAPDIVFVDFAFALQNWGEVMGCPLHREPGALAFALRAWGVGREIMESCWFEATEEEY